MTDKTEAMFADGWIKHDGGQCPVPHNTRVRYLMLDESEGTRPMWAGNLDWSHEGWGSDIIAYKVEQPQ